MVATQDLQPGDKLRRFKEEAAHEDSGDDNAVTSALVDTEAPSGSRAAAVDGERPSAKVVVEKE